MDLPAAPDPLRSGAIFQVSNFESLRSPVPKLTLGSLTDGMPRSAEGMPRAMPELPTASPLSQGEEGPGVSQDFEKLCSKSPYPKMTMSLGMQEPPSALMPPPPPKQPTAPASPLKSRAGSSATLSSRAEAGPLLPLTTPCPAGAPCSALAPRPAPHSPQLLPHGSAPSPSSLRQTRRSTTNRPSVRPRPSCTTPQRRLRRTARRIPT